MVHNVRARLLGALRPQTEGKPLSTTTEAPTVDQAETLNRELGECLAAMAVIDAEMRELTATMPTPEEFAERKARIVECMASMRACMARYREVKAMMASSGVVVDDVVKTRTAATASMLGTQGDRMQAQGVRLKHVAAAIRAHKVRRPAVRAIRQAPRTRRSRRATGSSASRGDPSPSEGDKPESPASPHAEARDVDSGTGGAR
jgi:hypothetical protein